MSAQCPPRKDLGEDLSTPLVPNFCSHQGLLSPPPVCRTCRHLFQPTESLVGWEGLGSPGPVCHGAAGVAVGHLSHQCLCFQPGSGREGPVQFQVGLLCIHSAPAQLEQPEPGLRASCILFCFSAAGCSLLFSHVNELCLKLKWEEEKNRVSVYGYVCVHTYIGGGGAADTLFFHFPLIKALWRCV